MRTAIYPGSFDPLTNGHYDLIQRASQLFDRVIVLISINTAKRTLFTIEERQKMVEEIVKPLGNVSVDVSEGLLVDYVETIKDAVIIKGLRALSDFEMEFQMALMNRHLKPTIETLFLMTSPDLSYVSSSIVKEVFKFGGRIDELVPNTVAKHMATKRG